MGVPGFTPGDVDNLQDAVAVPVHADEIGHGQGGDWAEGIGLKRQVPAKAEKPAPNKLLAAQQILVMY